MKRKKILAPWGITLLSTELVISNDQTTHNGVVESTLALPHLPFAVRIDENGLFAELITALGIERLGHINLLQRLTVFRVGSSEGRKCKPPHITYNTRLLHSVWAAIFALLIAKKHRWTFEETLVQVVVELVHDAKTAAGGDALKVLNENAFDEDALIMQHFREINTSWLPIKQRFGLPNDVESRIAKAISEDYGVNGKIHNIVDTLSYLLLDTASLENCYDRWNIPTPQYHRRIITLAKTVTNTWQDIQISGEAVFFSQPELLDNFLELRALLWTELYNHPGHKGLEALLCRIILPDLFERCPDFSKNLFKQDDRWLLRLIAEHYGLPEDLSSLTLGAHQPPKCEIFGTWSEGRAEEEQAARNGKLTLLYSTNLFPRIKSKTDKYFVKKDGEKKPSSFHEAFPGKARKIVRAVDRNYHDNRVYLLSWLAIPGTSFPDALRKIWEKTRRSWDKETFHNSRCNKARPSSV